MKPLSTGAHETVLKRIRDIPSLPEVVNQILAIINKPNTPASEIAKLISYDPGLTSKVLRMVNSAAYGFQRQISSIQHAIMILGFNNVRGLVLSASIFKLFKGQAHPGGLNHRDFWEHSLNTAVIARYLAKKLCITESDDVFSAALLHDIGKVVLDVYFKEHYFQVLQVAREKQIPFHGAPFLNLEEHKLGVSHAGIGSFLATKWKLPVSIASVILYHHIPEQAEHCQELVHLVALANAIDGSWTHSPIKKEDLPAISSDLIDYFDLPPGELESLWPSLEKELQSTHELLSSFTGNT